MKSKFIQFVLTASFCLAASHSVHAQGTVRYVSNVNQPFSQFDSVYEMDADSDGTTDFSFRTDGASLKIFPSEGSYVLALLPQPPDVSSNVIPIPAGVEIGDFGYDPVMWVPTRLSRTGRPLGSTMNSCVIGGCTVFFVGVEAYVGFQFLIEGETHYGWMLFDGGAPGGVLKDYAYNTVPGASIFTAQVPEPSTWALLIGGGAFLWWRCRRKRTAPNVSG